MKKIFISLIYFFVTNDPTYAGILGPSNYEDCVLEKLKDAKTDLGVQTVYAMCREKFPEKKSNRMPSSIPPVCLLYWNGLKTSILEKEPSEWRKSYAQYEVQRYNMTVAKVFVPKQFELNKDSESQMYSQVQIYCK